MVTGLNNIVNKLKNSTKGLEARAYDAIKKSAQPIVNDAQAAINSRTGNLRASIGFIERNKRYKSAVIIGPRTYGSWKGYHAYLIAGGWKRQRYDGTVTIVPPNPFLSRAFDKNQASVKANIQKELSALISKQFKK